MLLAHLSDAHFSTVTYNPSQFLSKRWLGNFNLALFRRHAYQTTHLPHLPELLNSLGVEHVFFTGDFTQTALDEEFAKSKKFLEHFSQRVFVLPGNHDVYTKKSERSKQFYNYFSEDALKHNRVSKTYLGKNWWWVALDCALATPVFFSHGKFFKEMEEPLEHLLASIPSDQHVIMGNHFPLFSTGRPRHDLAGAERLQEILTKHANVKLYLHGHDHQPYLIDRRDEGYPLVLNAGSCAHQPDGFFYLIDLQETQCLVQNLLFKKDEKGFSWVIDAQKTFNLS